MNIINHGKWVRYQPDKLPDGLPLTVMFAQREVDNVDWYEYSRDGSHFGSDAVKFIAHYQDRPDGFAGYIIGAAVLDVSMLFPAGAVIGEIVDYEGTNPQRDFGNKIYDPVAGTITDFPAAPARDPFALVRELVERVSALEAKLK